jgi:co-chaperonin GroES (HSP10)
VDGEERCIEVGEVIAVPVYMVDINGSEIELKEGDKILFSTFTTFDFKLNDKVAYAINAKDIIAIL